jgi:hypothetical protein
MRARVWLGIAGIASLVIVAVTFNVTRKHFAENDDELLHERALAYAGAHLGGAAVASIAKGGDPDSASSVRMTPGESRGDGAALSPAEELAARKAWPAATVRQDQIDQALQDFKGIKGRGHRKAPLKWTSIGPLVAFQPGVLGFTGRDQVTAGRTTALLVDRTCNQGNCRVWIGAAGGGVWRTDHGMHTNNPGWKFSSDGLGSNAFGSLAQDPNDKKGDTLYAGTGEPNASGDSEAGLGLYKSTDGGDSWTLIPASTAIAATRSIAKIAIDPTDGRIIYIATARGVRGISSTSGGASTTTGAAQPNVGVYKTTNGGATWTLVWDAQAAGSIRGVTDLEIDPYDRTTVYASAFQRGIYRSLGGGPFQQVFAAQLPASNVDRTEFALAALPGGKTRVYATNGSQGVPNPYAALFRNDDASLLVQGSPNAALWKKITSNVNGTPYYATFDFCTGQCWYDQDVMTPRGQPDTVFVIGSYTYGELGGRSNARAVLRSTTAGEPDPAHNDRTFTDMTLDAQSPPYGIHPDQHELAFHPTNPNIWWSTSDGGVVRSSGEYVDVTSQCADRPIGAASMLTCNRMLSAVPSNIFSLNEGLMTLQFMSVSVNPFDPTGEVQGGTQDNGTWLYDGHAKVWKQTIYGDGGTSGFDVGNPAIRFNQFFGGFGDVNFQSGDPTAWVVVTAPMLNSGEAVGFYWPEIADPSVAGTMYTGFQHVWRTKDNAGNQSFLEVNCPEFTTPGNQVGCGDWVALGGLGGPGNAGDLTSTLYGADRAGGIMGRVARAPSDTGTLWAATSLGRLFITKNSAAEPATSVAFTRLDSLVLNDPNRFISGIYVDASNPNRAWVTYSGYNTTIGSTAPGHVFEVTFNPAGSSATWVDRSYDLADLPVTDVARDDPTGDLYVSTDFGVLRLESGDTSWEVAGDGLPVVETPGLTIVTSARRLYAATHGMGMWYLTLPSGRQDSDHDRDR